MRKYLLLAGAALIGLGGSAYAAINCAVPPTCDELGYVMNPDECLTDDVLTCPFDDGKVFCFRKGRPLPGETTNCELGSVLYSDMQCYDAHPGGDVIPIGVVFDTSKRLAIQRQVSSSLRWVRSGAVSWDIADLDNCGDLGLSYQYCEIDGKSNTQKIVAQLGSDKSDYAAGYCYNLTDGDTPKGSWFLPSMSELKTLYDNKETVKTALKTIGGETIPSGGHYWSSTEYNSGLALTLYLSNGDVDTDHKSTYYGTYYTRCAIAY